MSKPHSLLLLLCLLVSLSSLAQLSVSKDGTLATEEEYDEDVVDRKIYREHIPLDGAAVQYIPFRQDSLYGFVDKNTMQFVIKPKFSQVFAVYPEGAIVEYSKDKYDGWYGLVGYNGKFKIPAQFQNLYKEGNVYHGLLGGVRDKSNSDEHAASYTLNIYYDENGKGLFEVKSRRQQSFNETDSFAWFFFNGEYSIYDRKGKLRKKFNKEKDIHFIGIFNNTLVFGKDEKNNEYPQLYTGIDINGKERFRLRPKEELQANGLIQLNDTLFCAMDANNEGVEFITAKGDFLPFDINDGTVGFGFRNLFPYFISKQLFRVMSYDDNKRKMGMISKSGKMILPCVYDYLGSEENGEFAFLDTTTHLLGFMNVDGKVVVPAKIDPFSAHAAEAINSNLKFSDGLCLSAEQKVYHTAAEAEKAYEEAKADGVDDEHNPLGDIRYVYYDRNGNKVLTLPDSITLAGNFSNGLAPVIARKSKGLGFIDKTGKLVIPTKYAIAMAGAYPMPVLVIPQFINGYAYLKAFKGYIDDKGHEYFAGKRVQDHYSFSH